MADRKMLNGRGEAAKEWLSPHASPLHDGVHFISTSFCTADQSPAVSLAR